MNHKEEMEYLKEHDPITYYELTSDPCGSDYDGGFVGGIVWIAIVIGVLLLLCL